MSEVSYTENKFCRFCGGGGPKGRYMMGGGGYAEVKLWSYYSSVSSYVNWKLFNCSLVNCSIH